MIRNIFGLLLALLLVACLSPSANARKRRGPQPVTESAEDTDVLDSRMTRHEFKKYSKEFSDETAHKQKVRTKSKRLQLDLDNVNEDELNSDELEVLRYRRKKLERQQKKTLGDVFEEKKQKNEKRKQKFEKNVLKYFKSNKEQSQEVVSSEEVITPLKRAQVSVKEEDECNSSEEKCP